ncbi:MAG TPA: ATP-binding cassette domain-containing protein, partial [Corynebacterium sp.]|nr:ATP-binding cassette domain-containing protein [Corynebacterium sp.]
MLEVTNLDAGYGFLQVVWNVNIQVKPGEFVALVGPNGAGKSTTLKTIAGLVPVRSGSITFDGRPIAGMPAHQISQMGLSFVSESLNLFTNMSVYENLLLGAYHVHD